MNIAVVTAHPDDAEFSMAGTIIKYVQKGHQVINIICTNGNIGHPIMNKDEIAEIRRREAIEAANVMGSKVIFLDYDDEFFPDCKESRLKVLNSLRSIKPDIVFTMFPNDYTNADHRVVSNVTIDMSYLQFIKNIETEEKETESYAALCFMDVVGGNGFEPTDYIDITDVFELKVKALMKHESQMINMARVSNVISFIEEMKVMAAFRGLQSQCKYAEAFVAVNRYHRIFNRKLLPQCL
jgi:LmbE family N-acetylglucosaminyl deacetylase